MMLEAASTSETSINYQTIRRGFPKDGHPHLIVYKNFLSQFQQDGRNVQKMYFLLIKL